MAGKSVKVVTVGDVHGKFTELRTKLEMLQKRAGNFECGFCLGEFWSTDNAQNKAVLAGKFQFPFPIYVLGPISVKMESADLDSEASTSAASNLFYLGSKGIITLACGLIVAYLNGIEGSDLISNPLHFSDGTVADLIRSAQSGTPDYNGVDLLLTGQWPTDVWKFDGKRVKIESLSETLSCSSQIARLASILKPRYHFAALNNIYYERQPYRNHKVLAQTSVQVTRFVALAKFADPDKANRYLYAFNIIPLKKSVREQLVEQPPDTTEFPYASALNQLRKRALSKAAEQSGQQFFYDLSHGDSEEAGPSKKRGYKASRDNQAPIAPCWFCLSSPEVEKHLVISIGEHAYVALAKGGLTPHHVLILPIDHVQSLAAGSDGLVEEIARFKDALSECVHDCLRMRMTFFERNFRSQHMQIQCVPVPTSVSEDNFLQNCISIGDLHNIKLTSIDVDSAEADPVISNLVTGGTPYFWIQAKARSKLLFHKIERSSGKDQQFPLQFGRELLSSRPILNIMDKVDWRECKLTRDQEFDHAQKFRNLFKKYDFTDASDDDDDDPDEDVI